MKFNRLGAFTLGVVITAVSVGAVSFVNAAGNGTLKACANKTTGVMRYNSKGSCKKTETSLSWNQMGPTGLSGSAGTNGTAGAKGDTGAAGTNGTAGTNGANGQNYYAVDATGKTLGPVLGHYTTAVDVLIDNIIWSLDTSKYNLAITQDGVSSAAYSDASCTVPYLQTPIGAVPNPQGMTIDWGANYNFDSTDKTYRASGNQVSLTGITLYRWLSLTCTAYSEPAKLSMLASYAFYSLTEVTKPTYTAPLTIVAR